MFNVSLVEGEVSATLGVSVGPQLGNWANANDYARDIINDLNNWAIGWTDWNCALDTKVMRISTQKAAIIYREVRIG